MKPIIEVDRLYKKYRIGEKELYYSFRDSIINFAKSPFNQKNRLKKNEFWALKNISFKVMPGEVVGIIGRNGAGKTTLLKTLSQITHLTKGKIVLRGRVASLLEVGTGFHTELTGRENIFLNGAILGMKRAEIKNKFNQIVEFAETQKFLDTPVKYYSSGMYMRLAFAVAAHLEPEILLIDEVLAVGDAQFQKKCLGKMRNISKDEGRTILFVSHNIEAVQNLCPRTIYLENGKIAYAGKTEIAIKMYGRYGQKLNTPQNINRRSAVGEVIITKVKLSGGGRQNNSIHYKKALNFTINFQIKKSVFNLDIGLLIKNRQQVNVAFTNISEIFDAKQKNLQPGKYCAEVTIPGNTLVPGVYYATVSAHVRGYRDIDKLENIIQFTILDTDSPLSGYGKLASDLSCVFVNAKWQLRLQK